MFHTSVFSRVTEKKIFFQFFILIQSYSNTIEQVRVERIRHGSNRDVKDSNRSIR